MWPVARNLIGVYIPLVHGVAFVPSSTSPPLFLLFFLLSSPLLFSVHPSLELSLLQSPLPLLLSIFSPTTSSVLCSLRLLFSQHWCFAFLAGLSQRSDELCYSWEEERRREETAARMLGASPKAKKGATVKFGSMKNPPPVVAAAGGGAPAGGKVPAEEVWEVRPGGMLVQKRGGVADEEPVNVKPAPTIRVKVKHAGITHEIYINSQASFGELKKMVAARTGLHPDDQKVMYKDKERDSKAFLDMAGVKDRSKLVVVEDPEARARRLIEERRNGHLEKAAKAVAAVTAEVDKLAPKVAALDALVRKGEKVAENDVVQVTELLMNELLKLDAVVAEGDVKAQRRLQVKRVQKYVETLDAVMAKNAAIVRKSGEKLSSKQQQHPPARQQQAHHHHQYQQQQQQPEAQTRWEMFDLLSSLPSTSSASSTTTVSSTASSGAPLPPPANRLDWMLF